jgi:hypothetical protein
MHTMAQLRKRYDHDRVVMLMGRLWSWVGVGIACTLVSFAVVMFSHKLKQPILEAVFTGIGCIALCITILLVALFSLLNAVDVTIYTTRHRFRRILGAWLFNAPFIAGVLFMGYAIARWVFLPR